ncbi:hypothetical protein [Dactylosporangium salmoneum]|uniref:Uncharacterized protein n=1 Tax=Dactylosporangium salmoneum TaxID=53361 RepID=A0ABP5UMZ1_9ACTN
MANIATVFVRVEPRPGAEVTPDELFGLLMRPDRGSYNVPLWHRAGGGLVDLQYGARWTGVAAVDTIWDGIGDRLRSVWVRYMDSGAAYDQIGHRTDAAPGDDPEWRNCEYWYDEIRAGEQVLAEGLRSRRAENQRDVLGDLRLDSPTTPASAYPHDGWLGLWRDFGVPGPATDALEALKPSLDRAELCYQGRPVEVARRVGRGAWARWSLDDWDSCADLAYVEHFG